MAGDYRTARGWKRRRDQRLKINGVALLAAREPTRV
jgi:hypothetical protein